MTREEGTGTPASQPALERTYTPPTDQQLARFCAVRVLGPRATSEDEIEAVLLYFEFMPNVKEAWLREHRSFQEAAWALADDLEATAP